MYIYDGVEHHPSLKRKDLLRTEPDGELGWPTFASKMALDDDNDNDTYIYIYIIIIITLAIKIG